MDLGSTLFAVLVIILDIVAIISVVNGHSSNERKVLWTVVILLLPLIGMVLYFLFGRSAADA